LDLWQTFSVLLVPEAEVAVRRIVAQTTDKAAQGNLHLPHQMLSLEYVLMLELRQALLMMDAWVQFDKQHGRTECT
jgi:hypothetical protein